MPDYFLLTQNYNPCPNPNPLFDKCWPGPAESPKEPVTVRLDGSICMLRKPGPNSFAPKWSGSGMPCGPPNGIAYAQKSRLPQLGLAPAFMRNKPVFWASKFGIFYRFGQ